MGQAEPAKNSGTARYGSPLQGLCARESVAIAQSARTAINLYLCIFDCAAGKAEPERNA